MTMLSHSGSFCLFLGENRQYVFLINKLFIFSGNLLLEILQVVEIGVGGAKNFFEAKIKMVNQTNKFEDEIKQEQEENKTKVEEKKARQEEFKKMQSNFA